MHIEVHHNAPAARFEATVDGELCVADYRLQHGVMVMPHTAVAPRLQGRGIAAALVKHALDWARAQGLKVAPRCAYVAAYMRRHAEVRDLIA